MNRNLKRNVSRDKGFTLIELMVIVAILSILLVIAIATYQDYLIRSKVSEGLAFASEAKTGVSSFYYNTRRWPINNQEAGLPAAGNYSRYDFISELRIQDTPREGTISVVFDLPGSTADGRELHLVPSTLTEIIRWSCNSPASNALELVHLPANCRGD
jgi:type IV pilus assembly protein PilA